VPDHTAALPPCWACPCRGTRAPHGNRAYRAAWSCRRRRAGYGASARATAAGRPAPAVAPAPPARHW